LSPDLICARAPAHKLNKSRAQTARNRVEMIMM
jgi:hypothetical protein